MRRLSEKMELALVELEASRHPNADKRTMNRLVDRGLCVPSKPSGWKHTRAGKRVSAALGRLRPWLLASYLPEMPRNTVNESGKH